MKREGGFHFCDIIRYLIQLMNETTAGIVAMRAIVRYQNNTIITTKAGSGRDLLNVCVRADYACTGTGRR